MVEGSHQHLKRQQAFTFSRDLLAILHSPPINLPFTMVVVSVVGGTGSVGKTIVEAFLENGTHQVIVIGRKVSSETFS